jgi:GNAT superfamily N-acetyltransferase
VSRTRSEYRLAPLQVAPGSAPADTRHPTTADRDVLAALLLDAYRDTIDDEGEDLDDALAAVDHYLGAILGPHSYVVFDGGEPVAFAFVVVVDDLHYIDPVVVAPARKGRGLGRDAVRCSLRSLAAAGVSEVGATITDGNVASERLFVGLGFTRHGTWS